MHIEPIKPVVITPARYVLLPVATTMTGYSVKAIQCKRARGDCAQTSDGSQHSTFSSRYEIAGARTFANE